jgi:hypothetical protein
VALRIVSCWPSREYVTPKWVFDLGVSKFVVDIGSDEENRDPSPPCYEPEWWNPVYIEKYCNFVATCGRQFDGKPWLDYVDIRCYGTWGENHRFGAREPWPDNVSKRDTIIRFTDAHLAAFKKTPLAVSMSCDKDTPYPEGTAIDYALARGCWMRRDGFGPYISDAEERVMKAHWKTSLVIAENGRGLFEHVTGKIRRYWLPDSPVITMASVFDQMLDFHCNYIPLGWGDQDWDVLRWRPALLKQLWMKMGYRLVVRKATFPSEARRGNSITVKHTWANEAVGRLPVAYPLAFYLADTLGNVRLIHLDRNFDETAWYDDKPHTFTSQIEVPGDLPPGDYFLALALIDPESGKPAIALGIESSDSERRYVLGTIEVLP